jgi:hypothetical protein
MQSLIVFFLCVALCFATTTQEMICDNCRALVEYPAAQPDNQGLLAFVSFIRPAPFSVKGVVSADVPDDTRIIGHFYTALDNNVTGPVYLTNKDWTSENGEGEITIVYPSPKQVDESFDGKIEFRVETRFLPASTSSWSLNVDKYPGSIVILNPEVSYP